MLQPSYINVYETKRKKADAMEWSQISTLLILIERSYIISSLYVAKGPSP